MFRRSFLPLLAALICLGTLGSPARAAETDCDSSYCFSPADFSGEEKELAGICITSLPESPAGTLLLGTRVLRPGDILTAEQVSQMTFLPLRSAEDRTTRVGYLGIYADSVAPPAVMTLSIRGKEDKAPVAEDSAWETYKNLPGTGKLKASDPEGQALTYTLIRQGKRGTVTLGTDGSFTYSPKKNKVGIDSFTYTATDPAGNVSREATVTVTLLKPTEAAPYADTAGRSCRFTAEWMKHTGIFLGEQPGGEPCFNPDREVTRGEFVTMLVKALEIPTEEDLTATGYTDPIPGWLQPYLAAAVRSGLTAGLPDREVFGADTPITGAEAAVMLRNALDLSAGEAAGAAVEEADALPAWAQAAVDAAAREGFDLAPMEALTRENAALALYRAVQLNSRSVFTE